MTLSLPALLLLAARLAHAEEAVTIVAPDTPVHDGEAMPFGVKEAMKGSIFIDGCSPVEIEQKTAGKWLTTAVKVCEPDQGKGRGQVPATAVDGSLNFSIPTPPSGSGTYRAVLTWGTGCSPGFPLATAICTQMGSVTSAPFVVAPPVK